VVCHDFLLPLVSCDNVTFSMILYYNVFVTLKVCYFYYVAVSNMEYKIGLPFFVPTYGSSGYSVICSVTCSISGRML